MSFSKHERILSSRSSGTSQPNNSTLCFLQPTRTACFSKNCGYGCLPIPRRRRARSMESPSLGVGDGCRTQCSTRRQAREKREERARPFVKPRRRTDGTAPHYIATLIPLPSKRDQRRVYCRCHRRSIYFPIVILRSSKRIILTSHVFHAVLKSSLRSSIRRRPHMRFRPCVAPGGRGICAWVRAGPARPDHV